MGRVNRDIVRQRKRERVRRIRIVKFYFFLFLITFLFVGSILLAHLEKLSIQKIEVRGNITNSNEEIIDIVKKVIKGNYYYLYSRRNIVLLPQEEIKKELRLHFGRVNLVSINIENFNTLVVEIGEREPMALWCLDKGGCYFVDRTGLVFSEAPNFSDNVYLKLFGEIKDDPLGKKPIKASEFDIIARASEKLPEVLSENGIEEAEISKVFLTTDGDYELTVVQPGEFERLEWKVIFDQSDDLAHSFSNLSAMLASEIFKEEYAQNNKHLNYIDLRFGNKVFYKFK